LTWEALAKTKNISPIITAQDFLKQQIKDKNLVEESKRVIEQGKKVVWQVWETFWDIKTKAWDVKESFVTWIEKEKIKWLQANPLQADEFQRLSQRLDSPEW
jgi:hypothetical protein